MFAFFGDVSFGSIFCGEVVPLENILKPDGLKIDGERNELFIVQGARIFIYSLEGFKLKNELGKKGRDPGNLCPFPGVAEYIFPLIKIISLLAV